MKKKLDIKKNFIVSISIALLLISIGIQTSDLLKTDDYQINYEYVNIKDMAQANVTVKKDNSTIIDTLFKGSTSMDSVSETEMVPLEKVEATPLPAVKLSNTESNEVKPVWHLPTEMGYVTQNPHYGHVALDIGSPRGAAENIFPVANGVISGIYTDGAGAKIVTVLHNINGQKYTSQYVHLSTYASNIYVGKEVTINDSLGLMGTTGRSTGVHLHITLLDCALFDSNDPYCSDINGFFRYANTRLNQGFIGLGSLIYVPGEWYNR